LGVYRNMEIEEIILVALAGMVSVVAFFLKKESVKIEKSNEKLRNLEISLAKNGARDAERWNQTRTLLEDRRQDVIKIFEKINR
jgi:hypothetical protein